MRTDLVKRLLTKGHRVAIEVGKLEIKPASGNPVPDHWYRQYRDAIVADLVRKSGRNALVYVEYSVGAYRSGNSRYDGLTMQFRSLLSEDDCYCIFNVDLRRKRNSRYGKAGDPLPKGQFWVGKRSAFYQFWQSTGLAHAPRLGSYHDYMGNLKGMVYTAENAKAMNRLEAMSLRPLTVTYEEILAAYGISLPYNAPTVSRQLPDKGQTRMPYKDMDEAQYFRSLATDSAAGVKDYETSQHGSAGTRSRVLPPNCTKPPEEQTLAEWFRAYDE